MTEAALPLTFSCAGALTRYTVEKKRIRLRGCSMASMQRAVAMWGCSRQARIREARLCDGLIRATCSFVRSPSRKATRR